MSGEQQPSIIDGLSKRPHRRTRRVLKIVGLVTALAVVLGAALDLPEHATALLVLTEGVTDRELFATAVGREPAES